jgi:urocanate hydratase
MDGARPVRAHRGTTLTARCWQTEAPLRMLQNNLDPEVAERPDDLVVYGGTGRAARDWASFDAMVRTLTALRDDETMLVQSGRPVGVLQTHEWAPRVLIANSNLVDDWATWPEFRRLERLGLTMYGQMTAGSWIYIGTQGILQGTYETFAAVAAKRFGGTLAGTLTLTGGCGGMGGAQPLAVTLNGGVCLIVDVDETRLRRRVEHRYLDEVTTDLDDAVARCMAAKRDMRALSVGLVGNAAAVFPELLRRGVEIDVVTDQTSRTTRSATCPRAWTSATGPTTPRPSPRSSPTGPGSRWPGTSRRWSASWTPAPRCSTTATPSATRRGRADSTAPSPSRASCRPTSGRCSARARARSAGPPSPATRRTSPPPDRAVLDLFPDNDHLQRWIRAAQDKVAFQGLPARICWLGYGERDLAGLRFNEMVASGEISAPVVIGRDHLDSGSVASPYRETEAMADGSDAIADWPLLNALVNTASGASWVSSTTAAASASAARCTPGRSAWRRHPARRGQAGRGADQRPGLGVLRPRRRRLRHRGGRSRRSAGSRTPCRRGRGRSGGERGRPAGVIPGGSARWPLAGHATAQDCATRHPRAVGEVDVGRRVQDCTVGPRRRTARCPRR